jgi:hypothetical protein
MGVDVPVLNIIVLNEELDGVIVLVVDCWIFVDDNEAVDIMLDTGGDECIEVDESLIWAVEETNWVALVLNNVMDEFVFDCVEIGDESVCELIYVVAGRELEMFVISEFDGLPL